MKIVYAADNRWGAAYQLQGFLQNTCHEVKVAAYPKSGKLLSCIDWNLDAVPYNFNQLQTDIKDYYPDFVIIDGEPIIANLANKLDIPILYCSSLHLLDGIIWQRKQRAYSSTLEQLRRKLRSLPPGVAKLIYAPYGDLITPPQINDDFEWVQPYHTNAFQFGETILSLLEDPNRNSIIKKICDSSRKFKMVINRIDDDSYLSSLSQSSTLLMEGNVRQVADGIYNNRFLIFCPQVRDAENVLNAIICSDLKLGIDLGQIELAGTLALDKIEKAIENVAKKPSDCMMVNCKKLHERIDELWECM